MAVEENVTIFLCTHQLSYAEEIGTLFGFLAKGKLIGFGTLPELLKQKRDAVRLQVLGEAIPETFVSFITPDGSYAIPIADNADAARIIAEITGGGGRIFEARQMHMSLDDLYFAFQREGRA
jgi:ABC-2 type transport system ATP-binding protein